ncbi:UDP-2,3-diacylglucosamine diphosphatase, partial [Limnohabitans sp.]|uniref:UDP-2,3-diacylglucosamine diphosphatase n=1 Tax=Limnohabitans sp. TaxID=1907725 RepID=UPI00353054C6
IQTAKWLAYVGDWLYEFSLRMNTWLNRLRSRWGWSYWSLSAYLKLKVKKAVNFISDFELAVAEQAKQRGFDGVVCGHIHHAEIRDINGVLYCNDGDWVESLSALVEWQDGRLEVIHWREQAHSAVSSVQVLAA